MLKDGASSLYGADAIAGVVNVILKRSYNGAELTAEVGTSQHGGGFTRRVTGILGGGDLDKDGHNAYLSVEYQKDNAIMNRDRDFPFNTFDLRSIGGINGSGGQPSAPSGSIYGTVTPGHLGTPGDLTSGIADGVAQPLVPCGAGTTLVTNDPQNPGSYCLQNFVNYLAVQPDTERASVYGRFTVKLNDTTQAYLAASYYQNEITVPAAPTQINAGTPNNTNALALPPTLPDGSLNPNNPFAAQGQYALINYAFPGVFAGSADLKNHNARIASGVHGSWADWDVDAGVVVNHTWLNVSNFGFLNYNQLISDVTSGTYNFLDPSRNSPATLQALAPTLSKISTTDMDSLDLRASHALMDLPGGSLGLALGGEWRYEAQHDNELNPGGAAQGLGTAHTIGRRNVSGVFAELDAPLLASLEVDVSGRYDHYSDVGGNFSPKVGFKWKPFESLAIRGTYSKGFRAPGFAENGSSASGGFVVRPPPADFAAAHGNNGYVKPFAVELLAAANPNIKPEKARSFTFGLVYQPIPELSASLDYYDIKKTGVITGGDARAALGAYYAGQPLPTGTTVTPDNPDPQFPNALARPLIVAAEYLNQNALRTKGIDVDLIGRFDLGNDVHWTSELSGTEIFTWKLLLQDGSQQQFVGTQGPYAISSGAGTPRIRGSWSNTFNHGPLTLTGTLYYTSGLAMTAPDQGPGCISINTDTGNNFPASCRMPSFTDFDLTGNYDISDRISAYGAVLNVFDRKPAFDPINYAAVNYNPTYGQAGIVGRFFNVGVKVKL